MSFTRRAVAGLVAVPLALAALPLVATTAVAAPADGQAAAGYLSVHFLQTDYENIHYGYSEDGLAWTKLNNDKPIVKSNVGEKAIRDPHVMRLQEPDADGNNYVILGTDYHAQGSAGGASWSQFGRSQSLAISKSKDLVTWTDPQIVFAGFADAGCVWAPEAIWDPEVGRYLVYWSGRDATEGSATTATTNLRVYKTYTDDFTSFDQAEVWIDQSATGKDTAGNIIDTHISIGDDGDYYRFSTSDWRSVIDTASSLSGPWTRLVERDNAIVDGTSIIPEFDGQEVRTDTQVGVNGGEGWTGFHNKDGEFVGFIDQEGLKSFTIDKLSDLKSGGTFSAAGATFSGLFRHGSVLELTEAERDAVLEAYGPKQPQRDANEQADPIARYTFTDGSAEDEIGDADLTLHGAAAIDEDGDRGEVLALNGAEGTYAAFPQGFFDGRDYMTVSMDVKSSSSGNHFTWTYGLDSTTYFFAKYGSDGTLNSRITTGSWGSEQKADAAKLGNGDWRKLTWVFSGTEMTVYADGEQVAKNSATGLFASALGNDLLGYLGKSFYPDPYSKASYDSISIWNRDLSSDEVRALSGLDPVNPPEPKDCDDVSIDDTEDLVASYDFEQVGACDASVNKNHMTLEGGASIVDDADTGSKVLKLTGGTQHGAFPKGMFDGMDEFTIEMDVRNADTSGNFMTFAVGNDQNKYMFLRTRYDQVYAAITKQTYNNESGANATGLASKQDAWVNVKVSVSPEAIVVFRDGVQVAKQTVVNTTVSELGEDLSAYLGRSTYSADQYFKGSFDNVKVWSKALSAVDLIESGEIQVVTDDHVLTSRQTGTDPINVDVTLDYWDRNTGATDGDRVNLEDVAITYLTKPGETLTVKGGGAAAEHRDYSTPVEMVLTKADGTTVDYTVSPVVLHTPVRAAGETDATGVMGKKFFADPNVYSAPNGKYYIYATTDGHAGWSGSQIRGFESDDLVTWKDLGPMVDLNDQDLDGVYDKSKLPNRTYAWAPGMFHKDGKYYLYFSGGDTRPCGQNGESNVAISDRPDGGFEIWTGVNEGLGECAEAGRVAPGIDPAVFEDPANPGDHYITWGQSGIMYAKLNDDMATYEASTVFKQAVNEFREGAFLDARQHNGKWTYYFSYSKWDTNEERYRVAYATADSMAGPWTYRGEILTQNDALGIKGTGHHSITQVPNTDDWYIVYHMFLTDDMRPRLVDQLKNEQLRTGNKRETMIQRITFTEPTQAETDAGVVPLINVVPVVREPIAPERIPQIAIAGATGEDGTVRQGDTLTASFNDTWQATGYSWYRDGVKIQGADTATYTAGPADAAATQITVKGSARSTTVKWNGTDEWSTTTNPVSASLYTAGNVPDAVLTGIELTHLPEKRQYVPGEDLDLTGLVVTAKYSDGTERELEVEEYSVTGFDSDTEGVKTVKVTMDGTDFVKSFSVKVAIPTLCNVPGATVEASFSENLTTYKPENACDGNQAPRWSTWAGTKVSPVTYTMTAPDAHAVDRVAFTNIEGTIASVNVEYLDASGQWVAAIYGPATPAATNSETVIEFDPVTTTSIRITFNTPNSFLKIPEISVPLYTPVENGVVSVAVEVAPAGYWLATKAFDPSTVTVTGTFKDGTQRVLLPSEYDLVEPVIDSLGDKTGKVTVKPHLVDDSVTDKLVTGPVLVTVAAEQLRYAGDNRYLTSLDIASKTMVPGRPVFVASGESFADALVAAPVAAQTEGSVVLTEKDAMDSDMVDLIAEKNPSAVYVMGGSVVISDDVEQRLKAAVGAHRVERVSGIDRYATAEAAAKVFFHDGADGVLIASGTSLVDALTGSVVAGQQGWPVLYAKGDTHALPEASVRAMDQLKPIEAVVAGGVGVVHSGVEGTLRSQGVADVERDGGKTRYQTAAMLSERVVQPGDFQQRGVVMANGEAMADVLSFAHVAAGKGWPIQLSQADCLPGPAAAAIGDDHATRVAVGGGQVIGKDVFDNLTVCG